MFQRRRKSSKMSLSTYIFLLILNIKWKRRQAKNENKAEKLATTTFFHPVPNTRENRKSISPSRNIQGIGWSENEREESVYSFVIIVYNDVK